jgi:tRNA-dihydrouridine synthase A
MMDCTDRHDRFFLRLFSHHLLLYSEMVTAQAILLGDRDYLLGFNKEEHPVAVQLGGSEPAKLAEAARICEDYGYDEINLNVGCPSDRVQSGAFGACLMAEPELVAECVSAMEQAVSVPVTVKHRIGIDNQDSWEELLRFVRIQIDAGSDALIVHARKAWLKGLSPKQNREVPRLNYDWVYRLKKEFPGTEIIVNGGIKTLDQCQEHLKQVDGVMLGREPYTNPYMLAEVDRVIFNDDSQPSKTRGDILRQFLPYVERQMETGMPLSKVIRHIIGLYHGQPRARLWRRYLSDHAFQRNAGIDVIGKAAEFVEQVSPSDA